MRHFFRGGKGLFLRKGEQVNMLSCEPEPYTRPIKDTPTVYQLSSAQDLPWFYLCSAWLRSGYDRAVTPLRPCIGAPSEHHHSHIGTPSHKGRTWLGLGRVLVGIKAGITNTIFRPISNPLRRFFAQPSPSPTLAMTCLYTGYEQEMPKNGTRNIQGLHKDETRITLESTKNKTRNTQETPKPETRIRQESRNSTSKKTPERYCKGTGKVLKSGGKGTGEVLESYQRGTKEVLTGSRSVVALERDRDCFGVVPTSRNNEEVVNHAYMNRLVLKRFRGFCEEFGVKVESMVVNKNRGCQIALKEVVGANVKSKPFAYGLQLIALMIFCVFSNPDLLGTSAMAQSPHRAASRISFGDRVPFAQSPTKVGAVAKAKQEIATKGLVIGDSLPDWFWEQELQVVNHPQKSKTIKLSAYKGQLLVIDFLNTACVPCIKSVDKWNELQPDYRLEVSVLPIHLYGDNSRIAPFAVQRGWEMPIAVGNRADTLINQLFYVRRSFGQVWIKDGKLLAIPHNKDVSRTLIGRALTRRDLGIQMNDMLTYFDRRYYIKEEE